MTERLPLQRATAAVYVVFAAAGLGFASWASRIPQIRDGLDVTPGTLGLILLCIAFGSIVAMPLAGLVISTVGEARAVAVMAVVFAAGLSVVAVGFLHGVAPVAAGLIVAGIGNGTWDIAMNVQGAAVEQALGRSIMSRFHAGFSIGTVLGAGLGALMVATHVPVTAHLLAVAGVLAVTVPLATRYFLPTIDHAALDPDRLPGTRVSKGLLRAWLEPRTLLIGLFVLCMAFTEGTGNDWLSLGVIDGYGTSAALGTITLTVFLAAMTAGRWFGPAWINRHGRVVVMRVSAAVALAGLLLVVFGAAFPLALAGAALWGVGTALGFPTGISAAADDPRRAAARVSVAGSIGYVAFLAGPPLLGLVGDHVGVLRALTVTAGALGIALLVSGACAPLADDKKVATAVRR